MTTVPPTQLMFNEHLLYNIRNGGSSDLIKLRYKYLSCFLNILLKVESLKSVPVGNDTDDFKAH